LSHVSIKACKLGSLGAHWLAVVPSLRPSDALLSLPRPIFSPLLEPQHFAHHVLQGLFPGQSYTEHPNIHTRAAARLILFTSVRPSHSATRTFLSDSTALSPSAQMTKTPSRTTAHGSCHEVPDLDARGSSHSAARSSPARSEHVSHHEQHVLEFMCFSILDSKPPHPGLTRPQAREELGNLDVRNRQGTTVPLADRS
jgi:hypothetical protein